MSNLFNNFGIDLGPEIIVLSNTSDSGDPLSELHALAEQQAAIGQLPHAFNPVELRGVYLAKVLEVSRKRGKFTYICARCNKPISDAKKLVLDASVGLIYGNDCHDIVKQKQHNLQYIYRSDGSRAPAQPTQMQTFTCMTSGVEFRAVPENVQHCGTTPRSCAMCPGTGLKFKNLPCDFERWLADHRTRNK